MKMIGVDDAGRGPVLGNMFLAGVLIDDESEEEVLRELGAKDSKLLTAHKRKQIGEQVKFKYKYKVETSTPKEIDDFPNLNNLEAVKAGLIINYLMKDVPAGEKVKVIVDAPSINAKAWGEYLFDMLVKKDQVELFSEHKADLNWPVVSAASIIAKEGREENVKELKKELDVNFGSGYPSDPKTKEFLAENWNDPKFGSLIRKTWSTYKKLADKGKQKELYFL
jgi:ribonuclease HII